MAFDFRDLKKFKDNLGNKLNDKEINNCINSTVNELSGRLLRDVVRNTPHTEKSTGTLKKGWKVSNFKISGNTVTKDIYNQTYYAVYVEKGHRTRAKKDGSRGWVEGKFMLKRAENYVSKVMDRVIKEKIDKLLRGGFSGK